MSTAEDYDLVKAALTSAGVYAVDGPAKKLPTTADGWVAPAAVLYPAAPFHQYRRSSGGSSGRELRLTVICVGHTADDALDVADAVESAIGGMVLPGKGGPLRQTIATSPAPEPNADPVRVSMAVEYTTIRKG